MFKHCRSKFSILLVVLLASNVLPNMLLAQDYYDFTYTDRNSFLAAGWNFIALTPSGNSRNTEQTSGATVSFDQISHPGTIRIPVDAGDLYGGLNNTRNTLFRNIPSAWTRVRIKISSFAPIQSYQQAGLVLYQDDNNYVQITHNYDGASRITFLRESGGSAGNVNSIIKIVNTDLYLDLDRDPSTQNINAYYSIDGSTWNFVGVVTQTLNNPRLAIVTGGSPGGLPNADIAWAEVSYQTLSSMDELGVHPGSIVFNAIQGHPLNTTKSLYLSTVNGGIISWSQSSNVSWVTSDSQNGVTDGVLKIGVNTAGMSSGTYQGNVTIASSQSSRSPIVIPVTLVINPDVPVKVTTWRDGYASAMSVSVDDGRPSGYDLLRAKGFSGTYVSNGTTPPSFYTNYYNTRMELGSHTVTHPCFVLSNNIFKSQELDPNISGLISSTPQPAKDLITFVWPCGFTNYREQTVVSDLFLSARGYNINKLEDATPENFMNLKSYNSKEHSPYPPSDLKTVVDLAVMQQKWFNLVLHDYSNDDGAISYAATQDIWVVPIGSVIKYIMQRERFVLTNYNQNSARITYNVSRLPIPSSVSKNFEDAFGPNDLTTMQIDVDDSKTVENVFINGTASPYFLINLNGNIVLQTNVKLESGNTKAIEIKYVFQGINLTISGVTANSKVYNGTISATLNTGTAALVGVVSGDNVSLVTSGASGTFANKNVGSSKIVNTIGFTITGINAGNYLLSQPSITGNITAATVTIAGVTARNKIYDGTKTAVLNAQNATLIGVYGTDIVDLTLSGDAGNPVNKNGSAIKASLSIAKGSFINQTAGNSKPVATSDFILSGTDSGNYRLTQPSLIADILAKPLTITAKILTKSYRTTLVFAGNEFTATGLVAGDSVQLVSISSQGAAASAHVGTYDISISGVTNNNYDVNYIGGILTVNKSSIIVSANNINKVYGADNPPLSISYSGFVNGEDASILDVLPVAQTIANRNSDVGTYDIGLSQAVGTNYIFTYNEGTLNIIKANQTITFDGVPVEIRTTRETVLNATASSGLTVTFKASNSNIGVVDGNILTILSDGNLVITASQAGDHNWNAANDVIRPIHALPTFDNISSLFTPNNDGMNDYWVIPDLEQYNRLQVTVYNRFGKVVYESGSYNNDWDGTWNNAPLPSASYYYIMNSSSRGYLKGIVNIVR